MNNQPGRECEVLDCRSGRDRVSAISRFEVRHARLLCRRLSRAASQRPACPPRRGFPGPARTTADQVDQQLSCCSIRNDLQTVMASRFCGVGAGGRTWIPARPIKQERPRDFKSRSCVSNLLRPAKIFGGRAFLCKKKCKVSAFPSLAAVPTRPVSTQLRSDPTAPATAGNSQ